MFEQSKIQKTSAIYSEYISYACKFEQKITSKTGIPPNFKLVILKLRKET